MGPTLKNLIELSELLRQNLRKPKVSMQPICTLKNLTLSFPHKRIFENVTFTVNQGEKIGLLGLNGHGKSSLFKIMSEDLVADTTTPPFIFDKSKDFSLISIPQELPVVNGVSLSDYFYEFHPEWKKLKHEIDLINERLIDDHSLIEKQQKLFEKLHDTGEDRAHNLYLSYLKLFELENSDTPFEKLSGGEQRKLALAIGLSAPHKIVLWDEPTNHLDLETIEMFEEEISSSDKTVLIISHDRTLLNNLVDRILHIKDGKLQSFSGTYSAYLEFLKEKELERAKALDRLSNIERVETAWISRGARARRTKSKKRIADYSTLQNRIAELKSEAEKSVSLNILSTDRKSKILFDLENVSIGYHQTVLARNINLKIKNGDKIALIGKNGVGKSTFLNLLLGNHQETSGIMKRATDLKVGYFSQKREILNPDETPWGLIGEGLDHIISNTGVKRHVSGYLKNFLFETEELKRPIKTFSGGEKNRLQLAKFMKDAQDVWIFDEPTNDLDLVTISILEDELKKFEGTLIIVGHDRSFIENTTTRCLLLEDQKLEIFEGGYPQAEIHLEQKQIEERLRKMAPPKGDGSKKDRLSYQQRKRYENIQNEIDGCDKLIEKIKERLLRFDYQNMNKSKNDELFALQSQLKAEEEHQVKLYSEWEELESLK